MALRLVGSEMAALRLVGSEMAVLRLVGSETVVLRHVGSETVGVCSSPGRALCSFTFNRAVGQVLLPICRSIACLLCVLRAVRARYLGFSYFLVCARARARVCVWATKLSLGAARLSFKCMFESSQKDRHSTCDSTKSKHCFTTSFLQSLP